MVAVAVLVARIEAKFKLSQNRSRADMAGAIDGLERGREGGVSGLVRRRLP